MIEIKQKEINKIKSNYKNFIEACSFENGYKLTKRSEVSPYALCFAIFGYHLIKDEETIKKNRELWVKDIILNLDQKKASEDESNIIYSKPYLQLLTFSLSALRILGATDHHALKKHVCIILDYDIRELLIHLRAKDGVPSSGNISMFWAILLIHCKEILNLDVQNSIDFWVTYHTSSMNRHGFWGSSKTMTYSMFQNGYHQYEILDYMNVNGGFWKIASNSINNLKDPDYRFAPYPGGGGCYDYDALNILTSKKNGNDFDNTIINMFNTIVLSQNNDGGFCESKNIRPRNFSNIAKFINHFITRPNENKYEVLKRILSIQRVKHNRIHTHWTTYSREWSESDLWDSWFRVLLLARIDIYRDKTKFSNWGFIDYPGIGYHHLFKDE